MINNLSAAIKKIAPSCDSISWAGALNYYFDNAGITNPKRTAAFLGQTAVESMGFTRLEENLNYTTESRLMAVFGADHFPDGAEDFVYKPEALANRVYANRLGNGDEASGDGWKYRGRGPMQLTGKDNYTQFFKAMGVTDNPDWVATRAGGAASAVWFWKRITGINLLADMWAIRLITARVNGPALLGYQQRLSLSNTALAVLEAQTYA